MNISSYGPFAEILAALSALVAVFSLTLFKSIGPVKKWANLVENTLPFMISAGARAVCVAVIALSFMTISEGNYVYFAISALVLGAVVLLLVGWFDFLRKAYICDVPLLKKDGTQEVDRKKNPRTRPIVVGRVEDMRPLARKTYDKLGNVSLCKFLSGFGGNAVNDPGSVWPHDHLAKISFKITMVLMGIMLTSVSALYLAASAVEVHLRVPAVSTTETPRES